VKDMVVVIALVVAFALFVTAHVAIVYGLAWRPPRWRALVALLVPFVAPYWAWRERMRVRAGLWASAFVVYAVARIVGWR